MMYKKINSTEKRSVAREPVRGAAWKFNKMYTIYENSLNDPKLSRSQRLQKGNTIWIVTSIVVLLIVAILVYLAYHKMWIFKKKDEI